MEPRISPSEQKLRSIMQAAPLGLIEISQNGSIQDLNIEGERILNFISGRPIHSKDDFFSVSDAVSTGIRSAVYSFTQPSGLIIANESHSFPGGDGTLSYFQLTVTKMFADCIMVTIDDVSLKVAEEQALQKAEQDKAVAQGKYEIASEVLHDIGNAVVGFATHLTRLSRLLDGNNQARLDSISHYLTQQHPGIAGAIGEEKANALVDMLDGISKTGTEKQIAMKQAVNEQFRIMKHIQDILNIQRQYVLGHEPQERKPVILNQIITDCLGMISVSLERKKIIVTTQSSSPEIAIKGDRTKLMQVILNILKNSVESIVDSSPVKAINISIGEADMKIRLVISDTGKGIEKEVLEHLFVRGFTTKPNGTGLGLYNCKSIVESHSGKMMISSDGDGMGTQTIIEFNG